jgi:hypothetical protein
MAVEAEILLALRNHLVAFAQARSLPIAFTNKSLTPPADEKYLRETYLPNGIASRLIQASRQRLQGLYQIDLMWPQDAGETAAQTLAGDIAEHFNGDDFLVNGATSVRVTERPTLAGLLIEDTRAMLPVTVKWESWT